MAKAIELADCDPLTNLLNHRAFHHRLQTAAKGAPSGQSFQKTDARPYAPIPSLPTLAVAVLDIDNFKFFNDSYGHLAGDEVLCYVASTLRSYGRKDDVIARIGGMSLPSLLLLYRKPKR